MKPRFPLPQPHPQPLFAPSAGTGQSWPWLLVLLCAGLLFASSAAARCSTSSVMTKLHAPITFGHIALQNPYLHLPGDLIASVVVPPSALYLPPDDYLWKCAPEDLPNLYFLVASNGSGRVNDLYPFDDIGVDNVYQTMFNRVGIRQSMNGVTVSNIWSRVPLPPIEPNEDGHVYILPEHIPPLHAQLYSVWSAAKENNANCKQIKEPNLNRTNYDCEEPHAYIQLAGVRGLSYDQEGSDSNGADNQIAPKKGNGFGYRLFNALTLSRIPSCVLHGRMPQVTFPIVNVGDLDSPHGGGGKTVSAQISIQLECDLNAGSGTGENQTAISLQTSPNAYAAAQQLGLVTPGGGARYLLSDLHGNPTLAQGVGITLYNGKQQRYFSDPAAHGGQLTPDSGWYPFEDGATCKNKKIPIPDHDGYQECQLDWTVYLEKLPGQAVTPGEIQAVARVSIKVP